MKTIKPEQVLLYYDGPEIFEALDEWGAHYVAVKIDSTAEGEEYAVCGVSPRSLDRFRNGEIDLKSLMLEFGKDDWFKSTINSSGDALVLVPQRLALLSSGCLPDDGFTMPISLPHSIEIVGELDEVDLSNRNWRLKNADGKFAGVVRDNGPGLEGLRIGARYIFQCVAESDSLNSGWKLPQLYLIDWKSA
jgi:hypothetical protein